MRRRGAWWLVAACLAAGPAAAQSLDKTWLLQVGAYFPDIDSKLRVDSSRGLGTTVDFERDLGFNRHRTLPAFLLEWRPGDDWVFDAQYYKLGRTSTKSLERDISIGDTTYPVAGRVRAGFDSDIIRFTVGNRLFQWRNLEIGAGIGLHATDFSVFIEGEGSVGGGTRSFRTESRSLFAPLPTIGVFLNARPGRKVHVNARVDWLSLTIDDYNGRLINAEASLAYSLHRNIDVGAMYRLVDYRVRVTSADWTGRVDYKFNGPALFVQVGF
ncbi:hypothetical protein [Sandaracinobacteroides saxicola]|uniref:Outer membrane protein beta-barrel domain-containing protein n=1 Tax=Sandaracinobacteroides saxicola TaxID=2759707 RepID=A0A7G5IF70_9SPHN|nr:hypothetical protein [Sandaracinobacteroides saxicola]QMW22012.1 hypothetical protein H3309_11590 [Sandaracinobacteroides saxicola]